MTDIRLERPFLKQIRAGDVLVPLDDREMRVGVGLFEGALAVKCHGILTDLAADETGRVIGYTRVPLEEY